MAEELGGNGPQLADALDRSSPRGPRPGSIGATFGCADISEFETQQRSVPLSRLHHTGIGHVPNSRRL
jgi:hypothetical protein